MTGGDVVNNSYTVIAAGRVYRGWDRLECHHAAGQDLQRFGRQHGHYGDYRWHVYCLRKRHGNSDDRVRRFGQSIFRGDDMGRTRASLSKGRRPRLAANVMSGLLEPQTAPGGGWTELGSFGIVHRSKCLPDCHERQGRSGFDYVTPGSPSGTLSGTSDKSTGLTCANNCLTLNKSISDTYAVDANGRITLSTGGNALVGWLRDTTHFAVLSPNSIGLITQLDH